MSEDEPASPVARRRLVVVVAAVVAVLVAAGIVTFLVLGDDEQEGDEAGQRGDAAGTAGSVPAAVEVPGGEAAGPASEEDVAAARDLAAQAATAITDRDVEAMTRLSCDPDTVGAVEEFPTNATAEVVGDPDLSATAGTVGLEVTVGGTEPTVVPLPLEKRNGTWCVP